MPGPTTTSEKAARFDTLLPLLEAMHREFGEMSRKKPEAVLSPGKVEVLNRLVRDVLSILDGEPARAYLNDFNTELLPQNSDVTLMLGQVMAATVSFRYKYFRSLTPYGDREWCVEEAPSPPPNRGRGRRSRE
jgi:hypothetical protein